MTDAGTGAERLQRLLLARHLPGLDGLRAVSVFVVMLYHFGLSAVPGDLGVSSFFVLSGFLITWLLLKEFDRTGTVSFRAFYMRRVLRIFPAYYAFLALSLGLDYVRGDSRVRALVFPALTYLMNYYNALHGHPPTSIAHAWSLAIEEQFYILWPFCFVLIMRRPAREVFLLLLGAVAVFAGWRSFLSLSGTASVAYLYNAFDTRADILCLGCALAVGLRLEPVRRVAAVTARSALLPVLTLTLLLISRMGGSAAYHYSIGFTVDAMLVVILIVQILLLQHSPLWSWLEHPVARYLGAISYPLYLYHILGFGLARRLSIDQPAALRIALALGLSIVVASASYRFIEQPFMRLKKRFGPKTAAPMPAL